MKREIVAHKMLFNDYILQFEGYNTKTKSIVYMISTPLKY